jgi:hypothetical protein
LETLVSLFDAAHQKVLDFEKQNPPKEDAAFGSPLEVQRRELKSDEEKLRTAIKEWEQKSRETFEVWHFWLAGLLAIGSGWAALRYWNRWVGAGFIFVGFAEMIWATSPSFRGLSAVTEFDRLLVHKFAFSLISLVLLLLVWQLFEQYSSKNSEDE